MKRIFRTLADGLGHSAVAVLTIGLTASFSNHATSPAQAATLQAPQINSSLQASVLSQLEARLPVTSSHASVGHISDHWIAQFWRRRFRVRSSAYRNWGFSRGPSCPAEGEIVALTPVVDENDSPLAGVTPTYLTASSRPQFFFHMPALPATNGILTIRSEDSSINLTERYFYSTEFNVQGQEGIVGIRLPDEAPPLEIGQTYLWSVAVACDPGNIRDSLRVHGGVLERVADVSTTTTNRLEAYADQGIWQEPLSILAEQYYANPNDGAIASNWADLLNSVGLDPAITTAPIVQILDGQ